MGCHATFAGRMQTTILAEELPHGVGPRPRTVLTCACLGPHPDPIAPQPAHTDGLSCYLCWSDVRPLSSLSCAPEGVGPRPRTVLACACIGPHPDPIGVGIPLPPALPHLTIWPSRWHGTCFRRSFSNTNLSGGMHYWVLGVPYVSPTGFNEASATPTP